MGNSGLAGPCSLKTATDIYLSSGTHATDASALSTGINTTFNKSILLSEDKRNDTIVKHLVERSYRFHLPLDRKRQALKQQPTRLPLIKQPVRL